LIHSPVAQLLELGLEIIQLLITQIFRQHKLVTRFLLVNDEFIELRVDGASIAVLSVLNKEDH
jgi:hypothetical protein